MILFLGWVSISTSANRIILIGDSITHGVGSTDGLGFRDELHSRLTGIGYPFSFVGIFGSEPYQGHFQSGATIGQFYTGPGGNGSLDVGFDMDNNEPTIAVIHLGTNDVFLPDDVAPYRYDGGTAFTTTVSGKLAHLIEYLLDWHFGRGMHLETIFVCQIVPNAHFPDKVVELNGEIARLVEDANNGILPQIPSGIVRLVDQYSSIDPITMIGNDGSHPNDTGYGVMTDVFYDAFGQLPMYLSRVTDAQVNGPVGGQLSEPLTVHVTDLNGNNVQGVDVTFERVSGDAVLSDSQPVRTDAFGLAKANVQIVSESVTTFRAFATGLIESETSFQVTGVGFMRVSGQIRYGDTQDAIPDVSLERLQNSTVLAITGGDGNFNIESLSYGETVTLKPKKDGVVNPNGGPILSYDAALAARQVVGVEDLSTSSIQAADVDGDGQVTMNDAANIARYAVGLDIQAVAQVGEWRFDPEQLHYDFLSSPMENQNISGVLLGDIHGGWIASSLMKLDDRNKWSMSITPRFESSPTVTLLVHFHDGEGLLAADFSCVYDPQQLRFVTARSTDYTKAFHVNYHTTSDGVVRIGMYGTNPIGDDSPAIQIEFIRSSRGHLPSVDFADIYANDVLINNVQCPLDGNSDQIQFTQPILKQNTPNPFNEETVIHYYLATTEQISIEVMNNLGQRIDTLFEGEKVPGNHSVRWNGCDAQGRIVPSGMYYLRMVGQSGVYVRKLIKVR